MVVRSTFMSAATSFAALAFVDQFRAWSICCGEIFSGGGAMLGLIAPERLTE